MARPYSLDLRERILKNYDNGTPIEDLVQHYEVSRSSLYPHIKQRRETGNVALKEYKRGRKNKLASYEQEARKVIAEHPDATLVDFFELLSVHFIIVPATMSNYLHHLKITRKKDSDSNGTTSTRCCSAKCRRGAIRFLSVTLSLARNRQRACVVAKDVFKLAGTVMPLEVDCFMCPLTHSTKRWSRR